jgi:hypothetical protein
MFCGISGLLGGLFVLAVPFNILIIASPSGEFADVAFGIAFAFGVVAFLVVAFLPFVVVFLVVVFFAAIFFGLAMIFSFWFYYPNSDRHC